MNLRIRHTWNGSPCLPEEEVRIEMDWSSSALSIRVRAPYHGDPPPPTPPGSTDLLWEYEVVEIFVLGESERYTEIELGPHGHYLVLQLAGRRNPVRRGLPIRYQAEIRGNSWIGRAIIPMELLPANPSHLNATAIHGEGHHRRYLAWTPMPGAQPDFHRLEAYAPIVPENR